MHHAAFTQFSAAQLLIKLQIKGYPLFIGRPLPWD